MAEGSVILDVTSTVQLHMRNATSQGYNIKTLLKERGRRPQHPELHKRITSHKYNATYQGYNINSCPKERGRSYCSSTEHMEAAQLHKYNATPWIQHQASFERTRPKAALSRTPQAWTNFTSTTQHHKDTTSRLV